MVGNLNLNFKTNSLSENGYKDNQFIEHDLSLIIGLSHESDLSLYLDSRINDILKECGQFNLKENEYIFDLEYTFDEIVEDEDVEDLCLDYNFRDFY